MSHNHYPRFKKIKFGIAHLSSPPDCPDLGVVRSPPNPDVGKGAGRCCVTKLNALL
jgi:hypothetical protein